MVELHLFLVNQVALVVEVVETLMFQEEQVIILLLIQLKVLMVAHQVEVLLMQEAAEVVAQLK